MSFTYKGLSAELSRHTVTTEEIDRYMQHLADQNPRIEEITDRATKLGDEVVLDYAGFCDGEQFAGGTAEMQTLTLGSGMFIPGFEEQLVDQMPGDEVSVHVTFPEQYHSDALAGKAAEFKCKIHEIRVKMPYELNDTFAKEVGGCETFEQMHKQLGDRMQAYADQQNEMALQDRLLRQAAETLEFTPSEEAVEAAVEDQMQVLQAQLAQQGLNMEMYCQFLGNTIEDVRKESREQALEMLRIQQTVYEIARLEGLEAQQEEIEQALQLICRQNHITMEQLKAHYDAELEKAVIGNVLTSKVMQVLRENAVIQ